MQFNQSLALGSVQYRQLRCAIRMFWLTSFICGKAGQTTAIYPLVLLQQKMVSTSVQLSSVCTVYVVFQRTFPDHPTLIYNVKL